MDLDQAHSVLPSRTKEVTTPKFNLDTTVLQFQNQNLVRKLEAQKIECAALESKCIRLREKQGRYDDTLAVVNESWEELVDDLESCSARTKDSLGHRPDDKNRMIAEDGASCSPEDAFLSRLLETGATESSCALDIPNQIQEDRQVSSERSRNILRNIASAIEGLWCLKGELYAALWKTVPEAGLCREKTSTNIGTEVKSLRLAIGDLHLKHKSLVREMQGHWDIDAKNKAELKHLRGELDGTVAELEKSNRELATVKAERDAAKSGFFPVILGNKHVPSDRVRDKHKDLQDLESSLRDLLDQSSSRLLELKRLYEERIRILEQLSYLQNAMKNVKCISSSQAYILVGDQLVKAKADVVQYQAMFEKLQVEKDKLAWAEKELSVKNDIVNVFQRSSAVADSRITELGVEIQKQVKERNLIETKLEQALGEPGRKEIIEEFKALVSSFPDDMGRMQTQLSKYKEAASDVHSLRADVQSLSNVLDRKAKEIKKLSSRSVDQEAELQKLQALVHDLNESEEELKLMLEMYRRESTDSRDVLEARDSEYKAWAHVQSLSSSLDERNMELRVKTAIEAEATAQQGLAAAEAEIADLRRKLEASKRDKSRLSEVLKSKHEENEAYLSEIETIGQAYDDIQTQNQHLLQQITERDDYNIKLVLEGAHARQLRDALLMEKQNMGRGIEQARAFVDIHDMKAASIEDQLKSCSDQVQKLAEDRVQNSVTLENMQKRLCDVRKISPQLKDSLEETQSKLDRSRVGFAELQIELEKERFEKKRVEEDLEVLRRRASRLRSQIEGSSVVEKLQQELKEYKEILKCSICLDRRKEVVIMKCYHLFCSLCVQKILETRHRRCPECSTSFGANDVKSVYI